jgi:hypothetical protein
MPRIDYTYLVEPLKRLGKVFSEIVKIFKYELTYLDSAHESFQAFLRLEILCVYPLMLGKLIFMPNN